MGRALLFEVEALAMVEAGAATAWAATAEAAEAAMGMVEVEAEAVRQVTIVLAWLVRSCCAIGMALCKTSSIADVKALSVSGCSSGAGDGVDVLDRAETETPVNGAGVDAIVGTSPTMQ